MFKSIKNFVKNVVNGIREFFVEEYYEESVYYENQPAMNTATESAIYAELNESQRYYNVTLEKDYNETVNVNQYQYQMEEEIGYGFKDIMLAKTREKEQENERETVQHNGFTFRDIMLAKAKEHEEVSSQSKQKVFEEQPTMTFRDIMLAKAQERQKDLSELQVQEFVDESYNQQPKQIPESELMLKEILLLQAKKQTAATTLEPNYDKPKEQKVQKQTFDKGFNLQDAINGLRTMKKSKETNKKSRRRLFLEPYQMSWKEMRDNNKKVDSYFKFQVSIE